jgi:hypothetical protein
MIIGTGRGNRKIRGSPAPAIDRSRPKSVFRANDSPPAGMTGSRLVHRFVYQHAIGPEPDDPMWHFTGAGDDLTIHHECGNRACINLLHLQILPLKFNRELGDSKALYAV